MIKGIKRTSAFKSDVKSYKHDKKFYDDVNEVINILQSGQTLPEKYCNHPLRGEYKGCYDCHI